MKLEPNDISWTQKRNEHLDMSSRETDTPSKTNLSHSLETIAFFHLDKQVHLRAYFLTCFSRIRYRFNRDVKIYALLKMSSNLMYL